MPLTEDQKLRMEANRLKALKAREGKAVEKPAAKRQWNNSGVKIKVKCCLLTLKRFSVAFSYHQTLINRIRSMKSAQYEAMTRTWTLDVDQHHDLVKLCQELKAEVTLEGLPKSVLNAVKTAPQKRAFDLRAEVEPALYDNLMPFQREGIEFGLQMDGKLLIADDMGLGKTIQVTQLILTSLDNTPDSG